MNTAEGGFRITDGQLVLDSNQALPIRTTLPRGTMTQENLKPFPVPVQRCFVWDSGQPLPSTAAADDLAVSVGTYGTNTPALSAGDVKAAGAVTRYARVVFSLPLEYVAGETVTLRLHAGMLTAAADVSCTVDVQAYKTSREAGVTGGDLCATAAQSMNSTTFAAKDFTITATTLEPGDELDVRITIASNDAASVAAVKPTIGAILLLCDVQG